LEIALEAVEVSFNNTWFPATWERTVPAGERYRFADGTTAVVSSGEVPLRVRVDESGGADKEGEDEGEEVNEVVVFDCTVENYCTY
jgi:hypothetical protein